MDRLLTCTIVHLYTDNWRYKILNLFCIKTNKSQTNHRNIFFEGACFKYIDSNVFYYRYIFTCMNRMLMRNKIMGRNKSGTNPFMKTKKNGISNYSV